MIEYLEVEGTKYNTDQEEAINCWTQMQAGREKRSNPEGCETYGVNMEDKSFGGGEENPLQIRSDSPQARNTRIQEMTIQRRIMHKDEHIATFGESRGWQYIGVLKNRQEYSLWILSQPVKRNGFISDLQRYGRGRIARYDYPIGPDPTNDGGRQVYGPITMTGRGYDTYEE